MEQDAIYGIIKKEREVVELPAKAVASGSISEWFLDCIMVTGSVGIKDYLPGHKKKDWGSVVGILSE